VAASLRLENGPADFSPDHVMTFQGARNLTISTAQPLVKAALMRLADAWPTSIPFSELITDARTDVGTLGAALLNCYTKGLCELHVHAERFVLVPGDRPCACPLARLQASSGNAVTNRRHERVFLDDADRTLLSHLDGEHDRAALLEVLAPFVADRSAEAHLDERLATFGRQALLIPK
jgi:methyltransferase-like protein